MIRYALTIFLSAFLLFQVQPIIGKFILPWFGGSPAVWTSCMLFFQVVLLAGYSYAHLLASQLAPRVKVACHVALLLASLAFLPIAPSDSWKPTDAELPVARILALLTTSIGLPYFLLSSTGPLLQESFFRRTGRTPYRLYALSNVGSLLALVSYPFLFEPRMMLRTQIVDWSWGYGLFVALCGWCTLDFAREGEVAMSRGAARTDASGSIAAPGARQIALWLALAACGSVMLLATTNQLCQEITSIPLLWVLPLAVYLLSFIITFDREGWYHRTAFLALLALSVILVSAMIAKGHRMEMWPQLAIYIGTLFVCTMICHGELVKARPAPQFATLFYLMVSAGGALGGVLVAIVAPWVLPDFWEYHIGLATTIVLALGITSTRSTAGRRGSWPAWIKVTACVAVAVAVGLTLRWIAVSKQAFVNLETTRNFYGVLRVNEVPPEEGDGEDVPDRPGRRELMHGTILHGFQSLDPNERRRPTTYYVRSSGIGLALDHHPRRHADDPADRTLRIGVVGLGCGTLACYGRAGDSIRFYEINPAVIRVSDEYFSFRKDAQAAGAEVEVVLGNARINLEREFDATGPQQFDVLAVDAFSSDAIPMHLLTREAVELFRRHLKADGLLCLHLSNRFLNLAPVAFGIAEAVGCPCVLIAHNPTPEARAEGENYSDWAILTDNRDFLDSAEISSAAGGLKEGLKPLVWTDDFGSLWHVLDEE